MQVVKSRINFWPRPAWNDLNNSLLNYVALRGFSVSLADSDSSNINESLKKRNFRLLFLGSDAFSISSLDAVLRVFPATNLTVVVSNENNLVGKYARRNEIQLLHWDKLKKSSIVQEGLISEGSPSTKSNFDLGVVASFGHLIPERVIRSCQMGILNVHGSLLPKWRGATPVAHALMNGDHTTGVSIMKIAPFKFDIGPVLHQVSVPIHPHIRGVELRQHLAEVGAQALETVLQSLDSYIGNALPQNDAESTFAPKIVPELAHVQWEAQSAITIYNLFRGLNGFFKLKTSYMGRTVDLDDLSIFSSQDQDASSAPVRNQSQTIDSSTDFSNYYNSPGTAHVSSLPRSDQVPPGHIYYANNILCVKCTSENVENLQQVWIFIRKVKIGTKWMSAKDFQNGFLSKSLAASCFESIRPTIEIVTDKAVTT